MWLCYSHKLDLVYCEPCWLFADREDLKGKMSWTTNHWKNLSKAVKQHEASTVHTKACVVHDCWRKRGTIDKDMKVNLEQEESYWCKVLDRLINVTITLATNNLAFRGHRETIGEANNGNFLQIIELLAKYDGVLKDLLDRPANSVKYLHHDIQNQLIQIVAQKMHIDIIDDIKAAPFFSVIMDTSQDVVKQFSM